MKELQKNELIEIDGDSWAGDALRWCGRATENTWNFLRYQVAGWD